MGASQECVLVNALKKLDGAEALMGHITTYEAGY